MVRVHAALFRVIANTEIKEKEIRDYGRKNRNSEVVQRKERLRVY